MPNWPTEARGAVLTDGLSDALARAAAAVARLDQALRAHPLLPAFLYRSRLEAVRRQAAVDGRAIDPWHLAAMLEGLRLRMDHALRIIDRGMIFDAARHALDLHAWLTSPDFDQEGEVQRAEAALAASPNLTPFLAAAFGAHDWLDGGGERSPLRAALIRHWTRHRLLRAPAPLTGAAALRPETPWQVEAWVPTFLNALAEEAGDGLQLLFEMERIWFAARQAVAGGRRDSRAAMAIDIMAAAPLVSASSLASGLGMAVNNATALLDRFCRDGIAIEVTHRAKRRLYGLSGLAPLRDGVAAPRRPEPGRGRGRPPLPRAEPPPPPPGPPMPARPLTPLERRELDYSDLENAMAAADERIRETRRTLALLRDAAHSVSNHPADEETMSAPASGCPSVPVEARSRFQ